MGKGLPRSLSRAKANIIPVKRTRIVLNHKIDVSAAGAAKGFGSEVIGGLPEGYLKILGAAVLVSVDAGGIPVADVINGWNGDFGIGTTPAGDATITGADVDILASTVANAAAGQRATAHITAYNGTSHVIDNTANDKELNFNLLVDAASIANDADVSFGLSGVFEITYLTLLDD